MADQSTAQLAEAVARMKNTLIARATHEVAGGFGFGAERVALPMRYTLRSFMCSCNDPQLVQQAKLWGCP